MAAKFDAVKMVREIRDRLYEEMKNIDDDKLVEYINIRGKKALEELRGKAVKKVDK